MQKTEVTPDEAKKLLDAERYIYLDVRTPAEFEEGHVPSAINVPVAQLDQGTGRMEPSPDFVAQISARLPRDAKLIVGCRSGGRSAHACQILRSQGYTHALNMVGGFGGVTDQTGRLVQPGWTTLGYPVEKGSEKK